MGALVKNRDKFGGNSIYIYMMDVGVMRDEGVHRREREDEMKTGPVSYFNPR